MTGWCVLYDTGPLTLVKPSISSRVESFPTGARSRNMQLSRRCLASGVHLRQFARVSATPRTRSR